MAEIPQTFAPDRPMPPPVMGGLPDDASLSPAAQEADRVGAEQLIRTTLQQLANGIPIKDSNEVVRQAVGKISPADIRAGHISPSALGEIIAAVETAKSGGAHFDWRMATPDQIRDYAFKHGLDLSRFGLGHGPLSHTGDAGGNGARADSSGSQVQSNGRYGGLFGSETSIPMAQALAKAMGLPSRDWLPYENRGALGAINTPQQWDRTPMAKLDGIRFNTFNNYLKPWGLKGSEIHQGVKDTKGIFGGHKEETPDLNGPTGAAMVRDNAILHKEAPNEAPHIVAAFKKQWEMMRSDPKLKLSEDHAAGVFKREGASDKDKNDAAADVARGIDRSYQQSGAASQVNNPNLSPTAKAAAGDEALKLKDAQVHLWTSRSGLSPTQSTDAARRVNEQFRLLHPELNEMPSGAAAQPRPGAPTPAAPATPASPIAPGPARRADLGLDRAAHQANAARADAGQIRDRTRQADASRDSHTAAKNARTGDKLSQAAGKVASQDDFFASTGGDQPKPAAASTAKPMVVAKADSAKTLPLASPPSQQVAENKPSTPTRPAVATPTSKPSQLTA